MINGNKYETSPPYGDYVTCQTYNPATGTTSIFDEIMTQSTQDVVIANQKIYVAAQDSIIMYDANTLLRLYAIADSGLSRLHIFNDKLIISKQYPVVRFFVEVLNADDLSLVARIQNISGDCKGITSTKDSIYVGINGGYLSTEGKMAVIDFNSWTVTREINFGPNATGINDIHNYGGVLFSINETPYGVADEGSITAYDTYTMTHTNYVFNRRVGAAGSLTKNSGVIGNMLYLADGSNGFLCLNISDPTNVSILGELDALNTCLDLEISGNVAFIAEGVAGLRCIDIENPLIIFEISSFVQGSTI